MNQRTVPEQQKIHPFCRLSWSYVTVSTERKKKNCSPDYLAMAELNLRGAELDAAMLETMKDALQEIHRREEDYTTLNIQS